MRYNEPLLNDVRHKPTCGGFKVYQFAEADEDHPDEWLAAEMGHGR